ncbi:MAG TPA: hypothetical protein VII42_10635, partial [Caulobacteraceae bacterium]
MAEIHWLKPVGDSFSDALDWSGGRVPGPADDAILDAGGMGSAPYAVIVSTRETVVSIQTAANATLDVDAGMFTAAAGSGAGINAGT